MNVKVVVCATLFSIFVTASTEAGWQWRRYRTSCGYAYKRVYVPKQRTKTKTQTTVVNNLVGIPVPVTYNQPIAAQGTTVYGYSSLAESYDKLDMGLLYNQAARLTDQAQQLAGQAATDFSTMVQIEGQNRAEVAKILAQGQSARQALEAAGSARSSSSQTQQRTFSFRVTQENGEINVEKLEDSEQGHSDAAHEFSLSGAQSGAQNANSDSVSELLKNKCVSCHGNSTANGDLNLEQPITEEQQRAILNRVTTDDLSKRMPRNPDGGAGQKLSVDELQILFGAMGGQR